MVDFDFGSTEGIISIATHYELDLDHSKNLKKGRNSYLHSFITTFGDKLPLEQIISHALSHTSYVYDANPSNDLKEVLLFLLGVTDKKGKLMPNIQDGCEGWFRVSPQIVESSSYSDEFYLSVDKTVDKLFKADKAKTSSLLCAETMVDCLRAWSKLIDIENMMQVIFEKRLYYVLFDEELDQMKTFIYKNKLRFGKKQDKAATKCMEVLDAIKKANSQLPKGFSESAQKQIDKIFNIKNAGMSSVPFHDKFGMKTEIDEEEESLIPIVTPDKRAGDSATSDEIVTLDKRAVDSTTSDEDVPTRQIKKRKSNRKITTQGLSDEEHQGAHGDVSENLESEKAAVPVSQKYVGKCSVLAMIAAQAPVLHRAVAQEENTKRLQISFTTPIKQAMGTFKVAMFIDSVNAAGTSQIYTWKAKPLIYALGIAKSLNELFLGDRNDAYSEALINNINKFMPIRRYPGESNDDIKKAGSAYLFQAGGILELHLPSILREHIDEELNKIVQSFRNIICDANFHECYSLGAARSFIDVYKNNESFVEHAQALMRTGKSLDYTANRLAYDIYSDYENLFVNIKDLHIEVIKDCPLDVLLRNSDIKDFGRRLFGHLYSDVYAPIVFKNPRGKDYKKL